MLQTIFNSYPLVTRFMLFVLLPCIAIATCGVLYLKQALPPLEGTARITGLNSRVVIGRDDNGIVNINADNNADAYFALGYVHAQDRLWQMEMQRRLGQGRMSEIMGKSKLALDKYMRTLGLYNAAKLSASQLSPAAIDCLNSYALGVNTWLKTLKVLPIEYYFLGFSPEPWRPEDSLLQIKLLALNLSGNFQEELTFGQLLKHLGKEKASELFHENPETPNEKQGSDKSNIYTTLYAGLIELNQQLDQYLQSNDAKIGSNAWVVSGAHSSSGKPILANDPHLSTQIPSRWYLASIQGGDLDVTGATIPGLPLVLLGHNANIAWGGTYFPADVQDLYIEHLHPTIEHRYKLDDKWLDMTVVESEILIAADFPSFLRRPVTPIKWQARSTLRGPVISDVVPQAETPISLAWTALQEAQSIGEEKSMFDSSFESFYRINYASNLTTFESAVKHHLAPTFNFLYADALGNIAHFAGGKVPARNKGEGRYPKPGWDSSYSWVGAIPFVELPRTINPLNGYLITANDKNYSDNYSHFLSSSWDPGYRAKRINNLIQTQISEQQLFSVDNFRKMQGDTFNLQAKETLPFFVQLSLEDDRQLDAQAYLKGWDQKMHKSSVGASIYHAWFRHFYRQVITDELSVKPLHQNRKPYFDSYIDTPSPRFVKALLNGKALDWCEDIDTLRHESCDDIARNSLVKALRELEQIAGRNMENWYWGNIHKTYYSHPLFSEIELLDKIFDRSTASDGGDFTVNIAPSTYDKQKGYKQYLGAGYRQVIDVADWSRSGFIISTGQSANIVSSHYDDLIEPHQNINLLPIRGADTTKEFVLLPVISTRANKDLLEKNISTTHKTISKIHAENNH